MFLVIYMYVLKNNVKDELIINKSRFITLLFKINNFVETEGIIEKQELIKR